MIADALARLNWSLLTPILVLSCLQRMRKLWSAPQSVLMGLTCCLPRKSPQTGVEWGLVSGGMQKQDKKMHSLGLCLIVLEPTIFKKHILTQQTFYKNYEMHIDFALWSLLTFILAAAGNCFLLQPQGRSMHCFYTLVPLAMTLVYSLQTPLQIAYLTGWRAIEVKLAAALGVAVFVASILLLSLPGLDDWDPLGMGFGAMVSEAARHMQALRYSLRETPGEVSMVTLTVTVRLLMSAFVSLAAAGMVLPTLRFSQTLLTLTLGASRGGEMVGAPGPGSGSVSGPGSGTGNAAERALIWAEHFAPLLVALSCTGNLVPAHLGDSPKVGAAVAWLLLRLVCARMHLQSFLDTVTRSAYLLPDGLNVTKDAKIVAKIQYRTEYLVAAAAQLLALPILLLVLVLLHARYSTQGEGACLLAHSFLGRNDAPCRALFAASAADMAAATERTAQIGARGPWLSSVLDIMMHSHRNGGQITIDFFFKVARLHPLPGGLIRRMCLAALWALSSLWFALSSLAAAYWYVGPEWVVFLFGAQMEIATQHLPKPIPGGSQEDRAREAALMAAKSSVPHATSGYVRSAPAAPAVAGAAAAGAAPEGLSKKDQ